MKQPNKKSTDEATKQEIKAALGLQEIAHFEQYLGLPSLVGRRKKEGFNFIKEKIWHKLQGWEGKLLSQAGREVLIKAVIQAIPTYAMGRFKLPLGLCHEIETMIKKFWWGQRGEKRKIHWLKWDELTKSKMEGGMGFRDIAMFNDSLLAKQTWRLLKNPESLFYKVSQIVQLWRQNILVGVHMLGIASYMEGMSYLGAVVGGLEMEIQ